MASPEAFTARLSASYIDALRGLLDRADDLYGESEVAFLRIEPARCGGVLMIATDGPAMAILHDPQGRVSCPVGVRLPPAFRAACHRRADLLHGPDGEALVERPDFLQPGPVILTAHFALAMVKTPHPDFTPHDQPALAMAQIGDDKHWRDEDLRYSFALDYDWRAPFRHARAPAQTLHLEPGLYGAFAPIMELDDSDDVPNWSLELGGDKSPGLVRLSTVPNFVGLIMPMVPRELPPLPAFLTRELTEA